MKRLGMGVINGFIGGFAAIICGGHYRVINRFIGGFGCHVGSYMVIYGSRMALQVGLLQSEEQAHTFTPTEVNGDEDLIVFAICHVTAYIVYCHTNTQNQQEII